MVGIDAQRRGCSTTLLCVWVFINPPLDANVGASLATPVEGSIPASLLFDRDLENSQLCSGVASIIKLYQLL
jgi:hypothetical protein